MSCLNILSRRFCTSPPWISIHSPHLYCVSTSEYQISLIEAMGPNSRAHCLLHAGLAALDKPPMEPMRWIKLGLPLGATKYNLDR